MNDASDDEEDNEVDAGGISFPSAFDPHLPPSSSTSSSILVAASSSFKAPSASAQEAIDSHSVTQTPDLRRSFTEPTSSTSRVKETPLLHRQARLHSTKTPTSLAKEVSFIEETPLAQRHEEQKGRPEQRRTVSAPVPSAKPTATFSAQAPAMSWGSATLGKRKRASKGRLQLQPENKQIFKGLTFFYVPNDDKNPLRRTRITKAQEFGVTWATTWSPLVTHVVVDKALSYNNVVSFLKIPQIPHQMKLVNDDYPVHCWQYGAILDEKQPQYMVTGSHDMEESMAMEATQKSNISLKVKTKQSKPGRWDYVPPKGTPPRSEESSGTGLDVESSIKRGDKSRQDASSINYEAAEATSEELGDELDAAIREAKSLPLDNDDDDDDDRPPSRDLTEPSSSEEDNHPAVSSSQKLTGNKKEGISGQEFFSCMKGGTGHSNPSNPNAKTISQLQEMADIYTQTKDQWRSISYRKVISQLKRQTSWISTYNQAIAIPGVGARLALKIVEIATTNSFRRLESAKEDPSNQTLQLFMNIYGVGLNQASKWLAAGYTSLEDLKTKVDLTKTQQIGIEHYDDLLTRIPRHEVTALGEIIKNAAKQLDPEVEIIIGGSYRRGMPTSGDIDCIVTKPGTETSTEIFPFLYSLVSKLTDSGFLVCELSIPRADSGTKWHGCCVLPSPDSEEDDPPIWRRIDFLLVPAAELGAALIYFTGNDIFNRSIRLLASRKGMRLNQRGLYKDVMRGPQRTKINEGELVEGRDERKIFQALGVPWRKPTERIC